MGVAEPGLAPGGKRGCQEMIGVGVRARFLRSNCGNKALTWRPELRKSSGPVCKDGG